MNNFKTFLSLGSNLGDREGFIDKAKALIAQRIAPIEDSSSIYETEPWGDTNQGYFLNQIIRINTDVKPELLLLTILEIERSLGRIRNRRNGPRSIDIDILLIGNRIINSPDLIIPHPRMIDRKFVLIPLVEIAKEIKHPTFNKSMKELLSQCKDISYVKKQTSHEVKSQ